MMKFHPIKQHFFCSFKKCNFLFGCLRLILYFNPLPSCNQHKVFRAGAEIYCVLAYTPNQKVLRQSVMNKQ